MLAAHATSSSSAPNVRPRAELPTPHRPPTTVPPPRANPRRPMPGGRSGPGTRARRGPGRSRSPPSPSRGALPHVDRLAEVLEGVVCPAREALAAGHVVVEVAPGRDGPRSARAPGRPPPRIAGFVDRSNRVPQLGGMPVDRVGQATQWYGESRSPTPSAAGTTGRRMRRPRRRPGRVRSVRCRRPGSRSRGRNGRRAPSCPTRPRCARSR